MRDPVAEQMFLIRLMLAFGHTMITTIITGFALAFIQGPDLNYDILQAVSITSGVTNFGWALAPAVRWIRQDWKEFWEAREPRPVRNLSDLGGDASTGDAMNHHDVPQPPIAF